MNIYHYYPDTGIFAGESVATPDPLEEGNFLIPAYATTIPVEPTPEGFIAVFNGSVWINVEIEQPVIDEPQEPTDEEILNKVRFERNNIIQSTDWMVLKFLEQGQNVPLNVLDYRQALRDVTTALNPVAALEELKNNPIQL